MTDASEGRDERDEHDERDARGELDARDDRDAGPVEHERESSVELEDEPAADLEGEPSVDLEEEAVDFENLTLPQRIFVAAVQSPARGALVGLLLLFGFGFYVAFWFSFPRVAALLSAAAVVVGGVIAAVLMLLK
ncbi:hypothetical protein [Haloparvum sp. PAK95]|uniref:hypothetical protein n=1 Tax=Haloparvum sp. PAK95 TaxID=3418962 RepID=UPI003D2EFF2C